MTIKSLLNYKVKNRDFKYILNIMDMKKVHEALGNEKNEDIINTTFEDIETDKNNIIRQLPMTEEEQVELYEKLENYRYCADVENIKVGREIVWIPLQDVDQIKTKKGRILKIYDMPEDTNIIYMLYGKLYTIIFSKNLIFQKITEEENLILQMVEYLKNN